MRRPEPLARALKGALTGLNLDQRLRESQAMALWPDIVGDVTAAKTRPLYVNRGTLVVHVASSAWAHQLSLLKPRLLALIEHPALRAIDPDEYRAETAVMDLVRGRCEPGDDHDNDIRVPENTRLREFAKDIVAAVKINRGAD